MFRRWLFKPRTKRRNVPAGLLKAILSALLDSSFFGCRQVPQGPR